MAAFLLLRIDWPVWIQAGTGLVAVILSVVSLWQGKRIRELAEIVTKLSDQNTILAGLLKVEISNIKKSRMPIFVYKDVESRPYWIIFTVVNNGVEAVDVRVDDRTIKGDRFQVELKENGRVPNRGNMEIKINVLDDNPEGVDFEIYYESTYGEQFRQQVIKKGPDKNIQILPPAGFMKEV
ncbi:MAG TPA: hypothetical protein VG870_10965 [Chitinophagaceae bacterium]|nr:hypothetical protein [Chitinophagaceae bacterium]